ncbi:MAG: hypothetical protein K6T81_11195, partial [Alicyclobacillus macrosporangiidus]|uniref:glycerophosphodiester phosphodiesterase family protein n=1 Tax=Alicyclobacillus macrosporangiidus TaxID=392015 RepID=UPI0026E9700D
GLTIPPHEHGVRLFLAPLQRSLRDIDLDEQVVLPAMRNLAGGDRAEGVDPHAPLLSSFSAEALAGARAAAPDLPRGWLTSRIPQDWAARLDALACVALHTNHRHLTRAVARAVKDAGYWLFCYTVDDPARARELSDWGVDAFCTERIDLIGADFA